MRGPTSVYSKKHNSIKKVKAHLKDTILDKKRGSNNVMINFGANQHHQNVVKERLNESAKRSFNESDISNKFPKLSHTDNEPHQTILASSIPVVDKECLYYIENGSPKVSI